MNWEGILQTKANNNISGFLLVALLCLITWSWLCSTYFLFSLLTSAYSHIKLWFHIFIAACELASLRITPGHFPVCPKRRFLSWLAGRSANIAADLFLLVSVHTSLTIARQIWSATRSQWDHPWPGRRSDTRVQSILICPTEQVGPLSVFSQRCQTRVSGFWTREEVIRPYPLLGVCWRAALVVLGIYNISALGD